MNRLAYEKGIRLDTSGIEPDVVLTGDAAQLRQLVAVLVDNAVKYAVQDSAVTVTLTKKQSRICLAVHNVGSPIPPNALAHLFDRFYRADWRAQRAATAWDWPLQKPSPTCTTAGCGPKTATTA